MKNSGRGVRFKKRTVEDSYHLSIFELRESGPLSQPPRPWTATWGRGQAFHRLDISVPIDTPDGPVLHMTCALLDTSGIEHASIWEGIELVSTPCHFGGKRFWFVCPMRSCGRRIAKLYFPPNKNGFLCRHCHNLTYQGRQEHRNKLYEVFSRFTLYRRRWEEARSGRQKIRWAIRLFEANERVKAFWRDDHERFKRQIERLRGRAKLSKS